jgi:hypothetical protein
VVSEVVIEYNSGNWSMVDMVVDVRSLFVLFYFVLFLRLLCFGVWCLCALK